jgi:hypothetical protein
MAYYQGIILRLADTRKKNLETNNGATAIAYPRAGPLGSSIYRRIKMGPGLAAIDLNPVTAWIWPCGLDRQKRNSG